MGKYDQKTFLVKCIGPCSDILVTLGCDSGDCDLYAKESGPPTIAALNCEDCSLCKKRGGTYESCGDLSTDSAR